jgi:hypothetical protein
LFLPGGDGEEGGEDGVGAEHLKSATKREVRKFFSFSSKIKDVQLDCERLLISFSLPLGFLCFIFIYSYVCPLFGLCFELYRDFGLWFVVAGDTVASGRNAYVTFKDPMLSRLRFSCRYGIVHQLV